MLIQTLSPPFPRGGVDWLLRRAALAAACVALADWLFVLHTPGLSLALFLGALGIVAAVANPIRAHARIVSCATAMFGLGLLVVIEDLNLLSFGFALLGTGLFASLLSTPQPEDWRPRLRHALRTLVAGPVRLPSDLLRVLKLAHRRGHRSRLRATLLAWVVPVAFLATFLALFAAANPLIEALFDHIDLAALLRLLHPLRIFFWGFVLCAIWPLIHVRAMRRRVVPLAGAVTPAAPGDFYGLLGEATILRSLVLFNALFAVQTAMDFAYLWGGVALPQGMTHAAYAHRGAYPLVATALLAAGFVLVAMRRGGPGENSGLVRALVLAWTAQNVLLVLSSILRLDLYVAAYSLTYLRVAAFIWMLLVALGLLLIIVHIAWRKPNGWLLTVNAAALTLTLYASCFVPFSYLIADYNLTHCREFGGTGPALDIAYLHSLNGGVVPAIDRMLSRPEAATGPAGVRRALQDVRKDLVNRHGQATEDWRGWSLSAWRLERYLANKAPPASAYGQPTATQTRP